MTVQIIYKITLFMKLKIISKIVSLTNINISVISSTTNLDNLDVEI